MFHALRKIFSRHETIPTASKAADHWAQWQAENDAQKPRWVDWGEHPLFLALIYKELFGSQDTTLFHYLKQQHPAYGSQRALSLCSGDGTFESLLFQNRVFGRITGIDISSYRVERALAECGGSDNGLNFIVGDVNQGHYGRHLYDVVFAKAALHHIENLEAAFLGMRNCLKPGGHLVTVDFFGPTRFQWTDTQLQLANQCLKEIPEELRTTSKGQIKANVARPTIAEMIEADPSEAVRSADIYRMIQQEFRIIEEFDIGGTVFNLVFTADIINNFDPDNAAHQQIVQRVFDRERASITAGELQSDFKFIIAEVNTAPA